MHTWRKQQVPNCVIGLALAIVDLRPTKTKTPSCDSLKLRSACLSCLFLFPFWPCPFPRPLGTIFFVFLALILFLLFVFLFSFVLGCLVFLLAADIASLDKWRNLTLESRMQWLDCNIHLSSNSQSRCHGLRWVLVARRTQQDVTSCAGDEKDTGCHYCFLESMSASYCNS